MTSKKIRILYAIAETFPTHRADIKALFGKYLPRYGVESDILAVTPEGEDVAWEGGNTCLRQMKGGAAKIRLLTFFHMVRGLLSFNTHEYDAVQIRDMPVVAALAIIIARFRKFTVFYWMSYPIPEGQIELAKGRGLGSGLMKYLYPLVTGYAGKFLLYSFVLSRVSHIFVQSDVMKQEMVARGYLADKMTPVPMGVDLETVDEYQPLPIEDSLIQGKIVLVYLGILERARKIWVLFDMLKRVREVYPETVLILAGDTPDTDHREWLLEKAKQEGLDQSILWTGWLTMEQAWSYVYASDIALSPYPRGHLLDSASPTKVAEYMALGKPTVANDQPDQKATLTASGAGVSVEYTAEHFSDAVLKLVEDEQLRYEMSEAGRHWVREHRSYESLTPKLADVYFRLLSS